MLGLADIVIALVAVYPPFELVRNSMIHRFWWGWDFYREPCSPGGGNRSRRKHYSRTVNLLSPPKLEALMAEN